MHARCLLAASVILPFSLIFIGATTGFITYADYSEQSAKSLVPVIAAAPDLADVALPVGLKYLVLDKNYQVLETSLKGSALCACHGLCDLRKDQ